MNKTMWAWHGRIVTSAMIIALLLLSGCTQPIDSDSDEIPDEENKTTEPELTWWYIHHVDGCDENGRGIMNQTVWDPEYDECNVYYEGEENGEVPVEVFSSEGPWSEVPEGSLIHGRFGYQYGTLTFEMEISYRLMIDDELVAEHRRIVNPFPATVSGLPLARSQGEDWLDLTVHAPIPEGSSPTLEFWVNGTEVYNIIYDWKPYLCIIPPDHPKFEQHSENYFKDCRPGQH